jgi:hypothetical protein
LFAQADQSSSLSLFRGKPFWPADRTAATYSRNSQNDKKTALRLVGVFVDLMDADSRSVTLDKYNEATFLKEYSETVDGEIRGIHFSDLDVSKVVKVAITGVAA